MDIMRLEEMTRRPPVFSPGTNQMWNDPHISKHLLEAHLDPDWEAASRSRDNIDASLQWLQEEVLPSPPARILDLGCGPGLYALPLARAGYQVLGLDISPLSLEYGRQQAAGEGLQLEYREMDYRSLEYRECFDAVLLIYCDLGALIPTDRDLVLAGIGRALRPGGVFVFDVNIPASRGPEAEGRTWELDRDDFWSNKPYLALSETFYYPQEQAFLDQHLIWAQEEDVKIYRIWDLLYSRSDLERLLEKNGFSPVGFFAHITGKQYSPDSDNIAVVCRKKDM